MLSAAWACCYVCWQGGLLVCVEMRARTMYGGRHQELGQHGELLSDEFRSNMRNFNPAEHDGHAGFPIAADLAVVADLCSPGPQPILAPAIANHPPAIVAADAVPAAAAGPNLAVHLLLPFDPPLHIQIPFGTLLLFRCLQ